MLEILKNNRKQLLLLSAVAVGVIMIALTGNTNETTNNNTVSAYDRLDAYNTSIEKKLEAIIAQVEGAGETKVMVTLESSFENVYANNARLEENIASAFEAQSAKTTEKEIVLAGNGMSGEEPILLKEMCPRVKGVFVVCEGGDSEQVKGNIRSAVSALFGISETKICVTSS